MIIPLSTYQIAKRFCSRDNKNHTNLSAGLIIRYRLELITLNGVPALQEKQSRKTVNQQNHVNTRLVRE